MYGGSVSQDYGYLESPISVSMGMDPIEKDFGSGAGYRNIEFSNRSPFYMALRLDLNTAVLEDTPHYLLKPYSDQVIKLKAGTTRLCTKPTNKYPVAANPSGNAPLFWFHASNDLIQSVPAFPSVGIQDAPEVTSKSTLTTLESLDQVSGTQIIRIKRDVDTALQFIINNLGEAQNGPGNAAPTGLWRFPSGTAIEFLKGVLLPTADGTAPNSVMRKAYIDAISAAYKDADAGINKTILDMLETVATNEVAPTAGPSVWASRSVKVPKIMWMVGTAAAGWPSTGEVLTFHRVGSAASLSGLAYGFQLLKPHNEARLLMRSALTTDAWSGWREFSFLDNLVPEAWRAWPTVLTGWGAADGSYKKHPDGTVRLKGQLTPPSGGWTNGTTVFTLPAGYQPGTVRRFVCPGLASNNCIAVAMNVLDTGAVQAGATAGNALPSSINLAPISYQAEG